MKPQRADRPIDEAAPFWRRVPLEELAQEQGVRPARDLDEIAALWPADDDPDALLRYLLDERVARRRLADRPG